MARIRVSIVIDRSPASVWEELRLLDRHVDWMAEAHEIVFHSPRRNGLGTRFACVTRFGPLRFTDEMIVTVWREGREMRVRHTGPITGLSRFVSSRIRGDRTRLTHTAQLRFPWWLGGPVGAFVGAMVIRRLWRRNLRVLKALVESGRDPRSTPAG